VIDVLPITRRLLLIASVLVIAVLGALIESAPGWRHAYAVVVVAAALGSGVVGGSLAAIAALMAQAPAVVARVEAFGLAPDVVEQLVTVATLLVLGPVLGSRVTEARRQRARYVTVVAVQNTLRDDRPLLNSLVQLREQLTGHLHARVTLAVRDGDRWLVAGSSPPNPGSIGARAIELASAVFVPDTGDRRRPHRVLSVPLVLRDETIGV